MESKKLAQLVAQAADKVKAINLKTLDLSKLSSFTDYFVVASATSNRQTRAIADKILEELKKQNIRPHSVEGYEEGSWILLDFVDVVAHIFIEELRTRYDLEGFWKNAKSVPLRLKTRETKTDQRRKIKRPKSTRKK